MFTIGNSGNKLFAAAFSFTLTVAVMATAILPAYSTGALA